MKNRVGMNEMERTIVEGLATTCDPTDLFEEKLVTKIYPEYNFNVPYGIWTGGVPLYAVLPFYRQLIVHLDPFVDRQVFKVTYGVSIEELSQLRDAGRVVALLRRPYNMYPDYYDVLFGNHIPMNNRFEKIFLAKTGQDISQFDGLLQKRYGRETLPVTLKEEMIPRGLVEHAHGEITEIMAHRMVKLTILGLKDLATEIVTKLDMENAYRELHRYNRALAVPVIDALGGWDNLDSKHMDLVRRLGSDANQIMLPRDILFWLNEQMMYTYPTAVQSGLPFLKLVEDGDEAQENHKLLEAIHKQLAKADYATVRDLGESSKRLLSRIRKRVAELERRESTIAKWITSPIHYACTAISSVAFGLAATQLYEGQTNWGMVSGVMGLGAEIFRRHVDQIKVFLQTLNMRRDPIPVMIWRRISSRSKK